MSAPDPAPPTEAARFLRYLDLPDDYTPSPIDAPLEFLKRHLHQLPQHLALYFSSPVPPRDRTTLPLVRNRRLRYIESRDGAATLGWARARDRWPLLWEQSGTARDAQAQLGDFSAADERAWATSGFLGGDRGAALVGGLGALLSQYEAEREHERARLLRRDHAVRQSMMPQLAEEEEDDDSEDEEDVATATAATAAEDAAETIEQHKNAFTRLVRERLIYGLLEGFEYDDIDWNDSLDVDVDQQHEDAWFDADDDEEEAPMAVDRSATPDY